MNNKVCKEYIREIKTVFPVKSKQEREYIKNLSNDIAVVLILALISTVTYCIVLYEDYQITKRQEAVIAEDVIE